MDSRSGILIDVDDLEALVHALSRLLLDPELRRELGGGGLQRVRDEFDIDRTWRLLDPLYAEVAR